MYPSKPSVCNRINSIQTFCVLRCSDFLVLLVGLFVVCFVCCLLLLLFVCLFVCLFFLFFLCVFFGGGGFMCAFSSFVCFGVWFVLVLLFLLLLFLLIYLVVCLFGLPSDIKKTHINYS